VYREEVVVYMYIYIYICVYICSVVPEEDTWGERVGVGDGLAPQRVEGERTRFG
jgi:hypothetical protein